MLESKIKIRHNGCPGVVRKRNGLKANGVIGRWERGGLCRVLDSYFRIQNLKDPFARSFPGGNQVVDRYQLPNWFVKHVCIKKEGEKLTGREIDIRFKQISTHPHDGKDAKGGSEACTRALHRPPVHCLQGSFFDLLANFVEAGFFPFLKSVGMNQTVALNVLD